MTFRIGLDIDGCMYQWDKTARYMLREVLPNSPYKRDGPLGHASLHWDYIMQNVDPAHWKWLWTEGVRLGLFRHGHLFPGAIQAVRALAELGDVVVITHRPKAAVDDTLAWLAFQQLPLSGVHLLTEQEPKSNVQPRCDVYLDDRPENCTDLGEHTYGSVALMDRPWNQGFETPIVHRVHSWPEFVMWVKRVS